MANWGQLKNWSKSLWLISLFKWVQYHSVILCLLGAIAGIGLMTQLIACNQTTMSLVNPQSCSDLGGHPIDGCIEANCTDYLSAEECRRPDLQQRNNGTTGNANNDSDENRDQRGAEGRNRNSYTDGDHGNSSSGGSSDGDIPPQSDRTPAVFIVDQTEIPWEADILFVVDNSYSSEDEQENIANQIEPFLKGIRNWDYRIAIMTVDIDSSPNNRTRRYQDGKFIQFSNGQLFLTSKDRNGRSQHSENIKRFKTAIQRPETRACATDRSQCTDDERAICALNLSFYQNNQSEFFRPKGHLLVIIISDEDERSSAEYIRIKSRRGEDYSLQACDQPREFYQNVVERISPMKALSIHAVIIPPGDESCLKQQRNRGGVGNYGELYEEFARPSYQILDEFPNLKRGTVSSICDSHYGDVLGKVSSHLEKEPLPITLPCDNPLNVTVTTSQSKRSMEYEQTGRTLRITQEIPVGTRIHVRTVCRSQ